MTTFRPEPKRLYTGYYAKHGKHPKAVAITVVPNRRFPGIAHCKALAPSGYLLDRYKKGLITDLQYTEIYLGLLNSRGTPQQVLDTLEDGAVLVCYEGPGRFCHRHVAAGWLRRAGKDKVIIEELP